MKDKTLRGYIHQVDIGKLAYHQFFEKMKFSLGRKKYSSKCLKNKRCCFTDKNSGERLDMCINCDRRRVQKVQTR